MEVLFKHTLTEEEYIGFAQNLKRVKSTKKRQRIAFPMLILLFAFIFYLDIKDGIFGATHIIVIVVFIEFIVLYYVGKKKALNNLSKTYRSNFIMRKEQSVKMTDEFIYTKTDVSQMRTPWSEIKGITEYNGLIMLYITELHYITIIPYDELKEEEQASITEKLSSLT